MTKWSGGFQSPKWHHRPQEGGGHVSHGHENVESGHVHSGGTVPGGTYEHPALVRITSGFSLRVEKDERGR